MRVLDYCRKEQVLPSLEEIARIARCRSILHFVDKYRQLDEDHLHKEFERFPSLSILIQNTLRNCYRSTILLYSFLPRGFGAVNQTEDRSCWSSGDHARRVRSVEKIIKELGNELVIVSGLAKGIDATAHYASIRNGGKTIGVIGTGLDVFYPKSNQRLQAHMGEHHLILSEYGPGQAPLKFHFPERNRIIAGLCQAVIVAEARLRSGSLITCERAMEEGRDVFAIPGNILDGKSAGCHHLIQEGAKLVTSGQDILDELKYEL